MIGACHQTPQRSRTDSEAYGNGFVLTLWTDDASLARRADRAGIQRIGLDLETTGKAQRQQGLGTWISPHRIERLPAVRRSLRAAQLFARVNPVHPGSGDEVEQLLALGVTALMLPMFTSAEEVAWFTELVGGRAVVIPLLETRAAAAQISQLVEIDGIDEIHVGINDLAISINARSRFEVLSSNLLERVADAVRGAGLRLGIGAVGRVHDARMPVPPDLIYARYVELGASAALIARSYAAGATPGEELRREVLRSRSRLAWWHAAGPEQHRRAHRRLREAVADSRSW